MHRNLGWDDMLYVLGVGRAGSLSGAARELRVNHSTVFRRIGAIEEQLGVRLFDRHRDGYVPTASGEAVIALAEQMDREVVALERRLSGEDLRPSGTVRVTTTDTMIGTVTPLCHKFRRLYPEISVELVTGNQFLNLSRRDADIAIRPSRTPPETLHGRRIAAIAFAVYGSDDYLASTGGADLSRSHQWIGFDDTLSHLSAHAWLRENADPGRINMKANSFLTIMAAASSGMGLAVLPCYLADPEPGLRRISEPIPELETDFWLLVHEDLRKTARVRAFSDFIFAELTALRPRIEARG
ncbi:MAG TPA: LysR family transcriptional regulator [Allosphingosinicella sp.]|jgi:DNA-binding transcriptional LysR family regulator|nr:LysR family transcriptional regulator [Allosphingosinicella sp.]